MIFVSKQLPKILLFILATVQSYAALSQSHHGVVTGTVLDSGTGLPLYGVKITTRNDTSFISTTVDGKYLLPLKKGNHTITFTLNEYEEKIISQVNVESGSAVILNIVLQQTGQSESQRPSELSKEILSAVYNPLLFTRMNTAVHLENKVSHGIDRSISKVLGRFTGVHLQTIPDNSNQVSLSILGLPARYNNLNYNGGEWYSTIPSEKKYPLDLIPAESIESVSLQTFSNASIQGGVAGGNINITTRDVPVQNFITLTLGGGAFDKTFGKSFFGEKIGGLELFGLPGKSRDLPVGFPTTRSSASFSEKNPQEQVYLSKSLNNNLAPKEYNGSIPNDVIKLGYGHIFHLKKKRILGITAYLSHQRSQLAYKSTMQMMPDLSANPYSISNSGKPLITTQSNDLIYQQSALTGGIFNTALVYGKNKISFKNLFGSATQNNLTRRFDVNKPDEDPDAHSAINYQNSQRKFLQTSISGSHALGATNKLGLDWTLAYQYLQIRNPDEKYFLLRQDSTNPNLFEIASPTAQPFNPVRPDDPTQLDPNLTNTARSWKESRDHNFDATAKITFPFELFRQLQVFSGGIFIQSRNRVFHSDLYPTKGPGYYPLSQLIAPERYYPGGLSITNYFSNFGGSYSYIYANNRANYIASGNLGAAFFNFTNQFTSKLSATWGIRLETNSQLVSNAQYSYAEGFKNPTIIPLDKNIYVNSSVLLPSLQLQYQTKKNLQFHASVFRSVNRPLQQELTAYRYYDANAFMVHIGNPILQPTVIENYAAGIRWIPNARISVQVSGFHKYINQPIETILTPYTKASLMAQPHNTAPAQINIFNAAITIIPSSQYAENLLSNFSVFLNGNYTQGKVKEGPVRTLSFRIPEHELSGMPKYSGAAGLRFSKKRWPEFSIQYQLVSDYLYMLGSGPNVALNNGQSITQNPNFRMKKREEIDIVIGQKFFKSRIQLTAGILNLTANPYVIYQDLNGNKKFDEAIQTKTIAGVSGFYESGTDNTVHQIYTQRNYYLTLSYSFR